MDKCGVYLGIDSPRQTSKSCSMVGGSCLLRISTYQGIFINRSCPKVEIVATWFLCGQGDSRLSLGSP